MALLSEATKEKYFDLRVMERNLSRGLIKKAEADQVLKSLPDDAEFGVYGEEEKTEELAADESGSADSSLNS